MINNILVHVSVFLLQLRWFDRSAPCLVQQGKVCSVQCKFYILIIVVHEQVNYENIEQYNWYMHSDKNTYYVVDLQTIFTNSIKVPWFTNGINLFWLVFTAALIAREYTSIEWRGNVLNSVHYVGYKLVIWNYLIRGRNYFIQGRGMQI